MTKRSCTPTDSLWPLRIFTATAFVVNMVVNYLGLQGYFGGTNQEVSAKYPTLLTPAGYAFSIWGPIFSLQGIYALYVLLPGDAEKLPYIKLLNVFLPLGWLGEAAWTVAFNKELIPISSVLIAASCLFLLTAYLRITFPGKNAPVVTGTLKKVFFYLIFVLPTALNFGWLLVANLVNCLITCLYFQIDVAVPFVIGLVVFANSIAMYFLIENREAVVALVQMWGFIAVAAKQTSEPVIMACYAAAVLSILVLIAKAIQAIRAATTTTTTMEKIDWQEPQ